MRRILSGRQPFTRREPIGAPSRQVQFWEMIVFLFLIAPSMLLSFLALQQKNAGFVLVATATILRDLALISLIAYFLRRNREPVIRIGWTTRDAAHEAALGVILFVPMTLLAAVVASALQSAGFAGTPKSLAGLLIPKSGWEFALAFVLVLVVAFAEETIFRGYLILRLLAITRSRLAAAVLSSIIFSAGHGYEGTAGAATVAIIGLCLAAVYLWRRSLVAPAVMHFLQDFLGIVLLPLLAHHH